MVIVDSCGWLEWFTDGKLADAYQKYLADQDKLLVPAIIVYEGYGGCKRLHAADSARITDTRAAQYSNGG